MLISATVGRQLSVDCRHSEPGSSIQLDSQMTVWGRFCQENMHVGMLAKYLHCFYNRLFSLLQRIPFSRQV